MKKYFLSLLISAVALSSMPSMAQDAAAGASGAGGDSSKSKIFLTTSTYGVMAGSLVGLASLTFYRQPGKRLRNVAIGASLGLYTGLLLGAYMVYFVPDPSKPRPKEAPASAPSLDSDDPLSLGGQEPQSSLQMPKLVPLAMYDGEAVSFGIDYKF